MGGAFKSLYDTDGNNILLHEVDKNLELHTGSTESWREVYLTIHIDGLVEAMRKWMDTRRDDIPWITAYDPSVAGGFTLHDMIERWDSHTKHCQVCSGALTRC